MNLRSILLTLLLVGVAFSTQPLAGDESTQVPTVEQQERLFTTEVLPVLKAKCFACHGTDPDEIKGELDLTSRELMLQGGESGDPAIEPNDAEASLLIRAIKWDDLEMPPKENDRLNETQIEHFERWVNSGARWPDEARQKQIMANVKPTSGVLVKTSGGLSEDWTNRRYEPTDLWAYQPLKIDASIVDKPNAIDLFIERKRQDAGLSASPNVDKTLWLRRATFDLTGLPPTPTEIDRFLRDESPSAFSNVIDRLLSSQHYGEQMARHWLDVVRYADTAGLANDFSRPHAWRYRDYVVRSFNDDLPYDAFIRQQIAGDELNDKDPDNLIAVGFLRMGPWEQTAMSVAALTRQEWLDDVTNSVGVTFLGTTMRCFRCHDHKFDPLPTRDFYQMQAVFAPVQFADRDVSFQKVENTTRLAEEKERIDAWLKRHGIDIVISDDATDEERKQAWLGVGKVIRKQTQIRQRELQQFKPLALSVYNGSSNNYASNKPYHPVPEKTGGKPQSVNILQGGSPESPLEEVRPGVLSVVGGLVEGSTIPNAPQGRRIALANWIASTQNPLTARVIANRVWQWHFGVGIAANPNSFGKMGGKPTHPELLDYLASYLMDHNWSIKSLHRLIMNSECYRQSCDHPEAIEMAKIDPDNSMLWRFRPRRLAAEEIRDARLFVSGELNREMGGIPMRPAINLEVAFQPRHVMGSVAPSYEPSRQRSQRNRRSLYAVRIRTLNNPMMEVFDRPGPDLSCERRDESTVTPQVFNLFNSESSQLRAVAMADKLVRDYEDSNARLTAAFRAAYGRVPSESERAAAMAHLKEMSQHHSTRKLDERALPDSVVREMVEEQTGLLFQWREQLEDHKNYEYDLSPWDVNAETRAWADLCLVLMNSNEFVYVY